MNKIIPILLLLTVFLGCKTSKQEPTREVIADTSVQEELSIEEYMSQAIAYLKAKDYDRAVATCSTIFFKSQSKIWRAHMVAGIAYRNMNKFPEAINHFQKVIELRSFDPAAYSNLAATYTELGYNDIDLDLYNEALEIQSNFADAYNNRGNRYIDLQEYDKAIADFEEAMSLKPSGRDPYNNIGIAYMELAKYELAEEYLYKALEIDPDFIEALLSLKEVFEKQNKEKEANKLYERLIPLLTQNIEDSHYDCGSLLSRAEIYTKLGKDKLAQSDYRKANEMYNEIVEQNPDSWTMLNFRGRTFIGLQQYDKARADFNKALSFYPKSKEAKDKLAEIENK